MGTFLFANKKDMEALLKTQGKNPAHFVILDHYAWQKWISPEKNYSVSYLNANNYSKTLKFYRAEEAHTINYER